MSSAAIDMPTIEGQLERNGSLADFIWFRTGGPAEWLVKPKDVADLSAFLSQLDPHVPVLPVGVGSNLIVRDGGVPGVVVRLPKSLAKVSVEPGNRVRAGGGALGITVASKARDSRAQRSRMGSTRPLSIAGRSASVPARRVSVPDQPKSFAWRA